MNDEASVTVLTWTYVNSDDLPGKGKLVPEGWVRSGGYGILRRDDWSISVPESLIGDEYNIPAGVPWRREHFDGAENKTGEDAGVFA